jgi:hypothetical protein
VDMRRLSGGTARDRWVRSLAALLAFSFVTGLGLVASRLRSRSGATSDDGEVLSDEHQPAGYQPEKHRSDEPTDPDESAPSGLLVQTERLTVHREPGTGALDGAWWPSSSTAADVIPDLVGELPDELGRVSRVALSMADWSDEQPKTVPVGDRPVRLAWFAGMARHTARVTFENDEAITVLVLPPDTEQEAASSVLSTVGESRSRSELLAEAGLGD